MKSLLILRHAKSSWKDTGLEDHDRPLNRRGKRDAPRIGRLIARREMLPDLVLSSTAKRARSTAKRVARSSGFEGEVRLTPELYLAGPGEFVRVLRHLNGDYPRVMVVAHNPGLEELLELLTGRSEALPTAALAEVRLPIENWAELDARPLRGELTGLWRPRELED